MWKCKKCHNELEVSIRLDKDSTFKIGKRGYAIGKPSMSITYNRRERYTCRNCGNISDKNVKEIGYWEED